MAVVGVAWVLWDHARDPTYPSDFDYIWYAATALRHGLNPYAVIGPSGSWFHWYTPLYYPMPAILVALPLSFLPLVAARCAFVGVSSWLLFYGLLRTREAWWVLVALTAPFMLAARLSQWSILLTATLVLPRLSVVYPCKPTLGAICAAGHPPATIRRVWPWVLGGWVLLLAASFLALPEWVSWWLKAVRDSPHIKPLAALPGGALVLLALVRWRRPEARLLASYAIIPHTTVLYEALPAVLVARTRLELLTLAVLSGLGYVVQALWLRPADPAALVADSGRLTLLSVYLPALVMVLRRPNKDPAATTTSPQPESW